MDNNYLNQQLIPCKNCNRKFAEERLEIHLRSCKSINTKNSFQKNIQSSLDSKDLFMKKLEKELNTESSTIKNSKPLTLLCHLCGKEFGTQSLVIHLKTCEQSYIRGKKSLPNRPSKLDNIINNKEVDIDEIQEYNKEAESLYKELNFVSCPNCSRKFLPDRLEVHIKGCKSVKINSNARSPEKNNNSTKILEKFIKQIENSDKYSKANGNNNLTNKPVFLVCYCCGREFGKQSLEIHLKTCLQKFENEGMGKRKMAEIPNELENIFSKLKIGSDVSTDEIIQYNEVADKIFKEFTMKACPGCKRRFLPDRLEVHLRSCKEAANSENNTNKLFNITSRPRMLICPLCGREFGTMSLSIHMKTCKSKFELEQTQLPKNQRKSADLIIEKFNQANKNIDSQGNYNIDAMNNEAYEIFTKESLVQCENCSRRFLPDRLIVHLRSCKKKN